MDDIKASAAKHHEDAAYQYEMAAEMHREAAKHCASGNFEKAEHLAMSAAEADTVGNRLGLYVSQTSMMMMAERTEEGAELS